MSQADKFDTKALREIAPRIGYLTRKSWGNEVAKAADHIDAQAAEIERLREALRDLAEAGSEAWGNERPCVRVAFAALSGEPT